MKIRYKCACLPDEVEIDVPDRRPEGKLHDWMGAVQHCIGTDHRGRSPHCHRPTMEYAKIPVEDGAPAIGVPVTKQ